MYEGRSQSTLGLDVRWDVAPNLALKAQAERVSSESKGISIVRGDDLDGGRRRHAVRRLTRLRVLGAPTT